MKVVLLVLFKLYMIIILINTVAMPTEKLQSFGMHCGN